MKHEPLVIERTFHAPVARVWEALTDREQMKQWYFDIAAFEPRVGFAFTFTGENEGRVFVHRCVVTEASPRQLLCYSWAYEGYEGLSVVAFALFAEGDATRLVLTHEGLETFPPLPDFKRVNFVEGWTYIIGTSLKNFLEQSPADTGNEAGSKAETVVRE